MQTRRGLFALALLVLALPAHAQLVAGRDYRLVSPAQPTDAPGKIEVLEFFSYGCHYCFEFHPLVSAWSAKLPQDVVFRRVPIGLGRPDWGNLARAFYALQVTGDLARLDDSVFRAVQLQGIPMANKKEIGTWAGKQGVDVAAFSAAFDSFGVNTQTTRAETMARNYRIASTPTLVVDGKYVVMGSSHQEMLAITDSLIQQLRSDRKVKAAPPLK